MDHRVGSVNESIVIACFEPKLGRGQITAKDPNARLQIFVESGKWQVQLQGLPEPQFGVTRIAAADQQIQGRVMLLEQIRSDVRADVSGPTG